MYDKADENVRQSLGSEKVQNPYPPNNAGQAMRELNLSELIERRIEKCRMEIRALEDLRDYLPIKILTSGAGRFSAILS